MDTGVRGYARSRYSSDYTQFSKIISNLTGTTTRVHIIGNMDDITEWFSNISVFPSWYPTRRSTRHGFVQQNGRISIGIRSFGVRSKKKKKVFATWQKRLFSGWNEYGATRVVLATAMSSSSTVGATVYNEKKKNHESIRIRRARVPR